MGGGKGGSSQQAAPQMIGQPGQYIMGSYNPETGLPFENPDYQNPMGGFHMPSFEMPDNSAQQASYQAELQARADAEAKAAGEKERDNLYGDYMNAASSATDYINGEVDRERANANLMGIEYNLTDESKSTRISDYFASIWGEGDQANIENLFNQWGKPKGFDGFSITRGDGSKYASDEGAADGDKTKAVSGGAKPKKSIVAGDDENALGGATSILGGA